MIDISICIPTFNRANMLRQCLEHLASFSDMNFELLIGDNASDDDTEEVVRAMRGRFPHCTYLRHKQNLGFARNMDSILRRATRKYIYILNDDDIVFEDALRLATRVMNANASIVAMVGQYLSLRALDASITIDYSDAGATTIKQNAFASLLDNLSICDGHPIIRREIFESHCAYLDRTGTLIPLYFTLLQHGDLVAVNKPFFQHRTTGESLTARMAEAWFLDMANADLELAISGCAASLPPGSMIAARQRLLQLLYLQAARMSISRKAPYLLWLFLRRLMALDGAGDDLLIKCEYHFSHDILIDRIAGILRDSELDTVYFIPSAATNCVIAVLSSMLADTTFIQWPPQEPAPGDTWFVICDDRRNIATDVPGIHPLALKNLFSQTRLTSHACQLAVLQDRLVAHYQDQADIDKLLAPSRAFDIICSPYSDTE